MVKEIGEFYTTDRFRFLLHTLNHLLLHAGLCNSVSENESYEIETKFHRGFWTLNFVSTISIEIQ